MTKPHTPEPWRVHADTLIVKDSEDTWTVVAQLAFGDAEKEGVGRGANAARIVACVNALENIPTEDIENGIIEILGEEQHDI